MQSNVSQQNHHYETIDKIRFPAQIMLWIAQFHYTHFTTLQSNKSRIFETGDFPQLLFVIKMKTMTYDMILVFQIWVEFEAVEQRAEAAAFRPIRNRWQITQHLFAAENSSHPKIEKSQITQSFRVWDSRLCRDGRGRTWSEFEEWSCAENGHREAPLGGCKFKLSPKKMGVYVCCAQKIRVLYTQRPRAFPEKNLGKLIRLLKMVFLPLISRFVCRFSVCYIQLHTPPRAIQIAERFEQKSRDFRVFLQHIAQTRLKLVILLLQKS